MPQVTLPEIKLSELGDRIHEAANELPDELRERLSAAGERITVAAERVADAGGRLGSDVSDRVPEIRWPVSMLPASLRSLSGFRPPKVDLPGLELRLDLPRVDARDLGAAVSRLELPRVTVGRPRPGPPVVPLMILAAVGGAFLGWWLATSSVAAGQIRALAHRARARLGLVRDWEEGEEERHEDFLADEHALPLSQPPGGGPADGEPLAAPEASPVGPSASISGEDGSLRGASAAADASDEGSDGRSESDAAMPAGWPVRDGEGGIGPDQRAATGGTRTEGTGGTGFEPDAER